MKLDELLLKKFISYIFLNEFNLLYNAQKNMYFLSYNKIIKDKNKKIV